MAVASPSTVYAGGIVGGGAAGGAVAASEDRPGDDRQTHMDFSRETSLEATPVADVANTTHSGRSEGYQDPGGESSTTPVNEVDKNDASREEFVESWENSSPEERAEAVYEQGENKSKSQKLLETAMGPAGGATATTVASAVVGGTAAPFAAIAPAAMLTYMGVQSVQSGSFSQAARNTKDAVGGLASRAKTSVRDKYTSIKQSDTGSSGGSSDSGGFAGDKYDDER